VTIKLFSDSVSPVVISHRLYAVFCCDPLKDMENILHFQQSHEKEKGMDRAPILMATNRPGSF